MRYIDLNKGIKIHRKPQGSTRSGGFLRIWKPVLPLLTMSLVCCCSGGRAAIIFQNNECGSPSIRPTPAEAAKQDSIKDRGRTRRQEFNRAAVEQLLKTVEQTSSQQRIKFDYFSGHWEFVYPVETGYDLFKSALQKEPIGSRRWFALESVLGFAALNARQEDGRAEALPTYITLLDHAGEADKVQAQDILESSITDLVETLSSLNQYQRVNQDGLPKVALLKAFRVYLALEKQSDTALDRLPWAEAIIHTEDSKSFTLEIEARLNEQGTAEKYGLLKVAADLYASTNPQRALELLQQAKPLLHPADISQARRFYFSYVHLLEATQQISEAVVAQQEMVRLTSHGYAHLAGLYLRSGDDKGLKQILSTLETPHADEQEVVDTARSLIAAPEKNSAWDKEVQQSTVDLLSQYLSAPRIRNPEMEMEARLILARLLSLQHKWEEARSALALDILPARLSPRLAAAYIAESKRILQTQQPDADDALRSITNQTSESPKDHTIHQH